MAGRSHAARQIAALRSKGPRRGVPPSKGSSKLSASADLPRIIGNATYGAVQAKLEIGQPDDEFEREADRVAERVVQIRARQSEPTPGTEPAGVSNANKPASPGRSARAKVGETPRSPTTRSNEDHRAASPAPAVSPQRMQSVISRQVENSEDHPGPEEEEHVPLRLKSAASSPPEPPDDPASRTLVPSSTKANARSAIKSVHGRFGLGVGREGIHNPQPVSSLSGTEADGCSGVIQRTSTGGGAVPAPTASDLSAARTSGGEPLPAGVRSYMEPRFGQSFADVRLHRNARASTVARALSARAFTIGEDLFFRTGGFRPETHEGRRLIAHELTHVLQQRGQPATTIRRQEEEEEQLPEPFNVTWGGDRFRISFESEQRSPGSYRRLHLDLQYLGPHPTDEPSGVKRFTADDLAPRTLRAELRPAAAQEIVVDLYGDSVHMLRIQDDIAPSPGARTARTHHLTMLVDGLFEHSGPFTVFDPAAAAAGASPFVPSFLPGTVPVFEQLANVATGRYEATAAIDGDGDQQPELEMKIESDAFWSWASQMQNEERITVSLRQIHAPGGPTMQSDFVVRAPAGTGAGQRDQLSPVPANATLLAADITQLTDGRAPLLINLTSPPASSEVLEVYPPTQSGADIVYSVRKGSTRVNYHFPHDPVQRQQTVEAGERGLLGRVVFWDVRFGPYGDRFRFLIDRGSSTSVLAGLAPLSQGVPYSGDGVPISFTGSLYSVRLLENGPNHLSVDFDGNGSAELSIHDRLQETGASPEAERTHEFRFSGSAVGTDTTLTFTAQPSLTRIAGAFDADAQRIAAAAKATHGLQQIAEQGTYAQVRRAFEAAVLPMRKRALDSGWITQSTFDAWNEAELDMILLEAQVSSGRVEAALQLRAARRVQALYDALAAETRLEASAAPSLGSSSTSINPYTGEMTTIAPFVARTTPGAGAQAATNILVGRWSVAVAKYRELRAGLDRWIVERASRAGIRGSDLTRLRGSAAMLRELDAIADKNPKRAYAVFRPDKAFENNAGFIHQVSLELYYWRDGNTWHLIDLTNPLRPFSDSVSARSSDSDSIIALMGELDDEDHFCEGRIFWHVPGLATGQLTVEDHLTWRDFFTWLGIGLAVIGTVLSFGTGAIAVAGTVALVGSAVAGGTAAAINLYQSIHHGTATTTSILLDTTQILASITGVGALAAGRVLSVARVSAASSRPLTGARWAFWAGAAQRAVVPLAAANLGADALTIALITIDGYQQLDAIEQGPGTASAKREAKLRILAQLAFTGGLTAVSLRGNVAEIRMGRSVRIINVRGEPVVVPEGLSTSGRALTETGARISAAADPAALAAAEQAHLRTIRQRIEGPGGGAYARIEELALANQAGRAEGLLTADAAGGLARGGTPAGSLDDLTAEVARANNATRAHGIDVEFVLDVRATAGGSHEVRVIRRARTAATGDPRRLYVDVDARAAAQSRELGRVRSAAGRRAFRAELSPSGLIRVNGQVDIHPERLAQMPAGDLTALASSTRALADAGGDMAVLRRTNPTAHSQLEKFASSSPTPHSSGRPSQGYRLRFAHSHAAALDLIDGLLADVGTTRASERAFRDLSPDHLDRLYDLVAESMPSGTTNVRSQATRYALDQNPLNPSEFVNHYQFYVAELKRLAQVEIEAQIAAGTTVGRGTRRRIYGDTERALADAADPRVPSATASAQVRASYDRIRAQVAGRLGEASIDPNLTGADAVNAIRALPEVRFNSETAAVYHTNKHFGELPAARRPAGTAEFDAYSAAARATIGNTAQTAADVAETVAQRGGARSYSFTLTEGRRTMLAIVMVTDDGSVFLATLIPNI